LGYHLERAGAEPLIANSYRKLREHINNYCPDCEEGYCQELKEAFKEFIGANRDRFIIALAKALPENTSAGRKANALSNTQPDKNTPISAEDSKSIKPRRELIVRSIMKHKSDFQNREKVQALAKMLDEANIPLPRRDLSRRKASASKQEPKSWSEAAGLPSNSNEYKRLFSHEKGVLVRDLHPRQTN
jgi:hypothetical protein